MTGDGKQDGSAPEKATSGRDPVAEAPDVTQDPDAQVDQDSGPTTTAPAGERPTDPQSATQNQATTD